MIAEKPRAWPWQLQWEWVEEGCGSGTDGTGILLGEREGQVGVKTTPRDQGQRGRVGIEPEDKYFFHQEVGSGSEFSTPLGKYRECDC